MTRWLIDERGVRHHDMSKDLAIAWGSGHSYGVFAQYAVRNLGFAEVVYGRNGTQIAWRPTSVTVQTFAGLILLLTEKGCGRAMVSSLHDDLRYRICATTAATTKHLRNEFQTATCDGQGFFRARRRSPDSLGPDEALGRLLYALSSKGLSCDPIELWDLLTRYTASRFILTHAESERSPLNVLYWGQGYKSFDAAWASSAQGRVFEDQPDRAYARWAASAYRGALSTLEPSVDDVDASTWWPGRGRRRVEYTRLVMPIHVAGRGMCILSTAKVADRH